jgi:phosphoribosylformimino-5-aminoimidazole carboxamide ribotide isomerase
VARRWESLGAPRLHVVDLDGARGGQPLQAGAMAAICRAVRIPVEVSGGLRRIEDVVAAFEYGAQRVQFGSAAVRDPALVREAVFRYPGRIVVSIDGREGEVVTDGWEQRSGIEVFELAQRMVDAGVPRLMVTDISRDGTLEAPNFDLLAQLVASLPVPIVASGGVSKVEHLARLAAIGCEGAIVGRALYEGTIELPKALEAVRAC